jgi:isopentenyl phosphate kinase
MAAYWTPFHTAATNLEQNSSKVTVASIMNQMEQLIIQTLNSEGIPLSVIPMSAISIQPSNYSTIFLQISIPAIASNTIKF